MGTPLTDDELAAIEAEDTARMIRETCPTREADEGKRIVGLAICAALEMAGYPGEEEEGITLAIEWAIEQGAVDDLETLVATAQTRFDDEYDPETRS